MIEALRSLDDLEPERLDAPLPPAVPALLDDARATTQRAQAAHALPLEFVQSNYAEAWRHLVALARRAEVAGNRFVEWGSGAGVVTCLASLAGFEARGIENEPELVRMAEAMAARHAPAAQFLCDSFKPPDAYRGRYGGLDADTRRFATDADVVYAYPWPAEERVIADVFRHLCRPGTLLLTFHGRDAFRLRRLSGPVRG